METVEKANQEADTQDQKPNLYLSCVLECNQFSNTIGAIEATFSATYAG
jgi:hypothetical protein